MPSLARGIPNALRVVNKSFTRPPDSVNQCAIDSEAATRQVKIRNNFVCYHARPGVEFLDIWGRESYSEGHEALGNAFERNGCSPHGGQDGSGVVHHEGVRFATGIIRDNLVREPGRPLHHCESVSFGLVNNLRAARPISNAVQGFAGVGGRWRLSPPRTVDG